MRCAKSGRVTADGLLLLAPLGPSVLEPNLYKRKNKIKMFSLKIKNKLSNLIKIFNEFAYDKRVVGQISRNKRIIKETPNRQYKSKKGWNLLHLRWSL